uniref:Atos homolog A n=1 Tax=Pongo abelii TaxID=9601 RepID=A0A8I5U562_PONAB
MKPDRETRSHSVAQPGLMSSSNLPVSAS